MPVKTIDQIARETHRDVLWIRFLDFHHRDVHVDGAPEISEWDTPVRRRVLEVLEANGVAWIRCWPWLDDCWLAYSYEGDVYVDVPHAKDNPDFQKLSSLLEKDQHGTPAVDGAWLCVFALEDAMRYAYRDEPGWNDSP